MDMEIVPDHINNTCLKPKRPTARGIRGETERGLFTQPRPQPPGDTAAGPPAPLERVERTSTYAPPLSS
jgi:hypothetical protein